MAQFIDNINILSTSVVTYTTPGGTYDYNNNFIAMFNDDDSFTKLSMLNNQYSVKYRNESDFYARINNNPIIVNGMVASVGNNKQLRANSFGKRNFIYAAPRAVSGVYVEQNPFSEITFEIDPNRANYARPIIDGAVYNTSWTKIANNAQGAYLYASLTVSNTVTNLYTAARLSEMANNEYSAYPTFAQNLRNMSHGAARVAWGSIFFNYLGSQGYNPVNLFDGITILNGLWVMPFASDDEYNAAYAVLYKWPDYIISEINNWTR